FMHRLSIIEGPPGTGKTQTILNIIANAILNKQSVAVVSSNNSATQNVYEKLEKNNIEFVSALLGNAKNKEDFIESQKEVPDLSKFKLTSDQKTEIKEEAAQMVDQIADNLDKKNELALLCLQKENIFTEFQHFQESDTNDITIYVKKNISSNMIMRLWVSIENTAKRGKKIGWVGRFMNRLIYGIKDKSFYEHPIGDIITACQYKYYQTKISELTRRILFLENSLQDFRSEERRVGKDD